MAALVAIAKIWKPPRGPSVGEWQNILCIQTMDYYLELIKNELSSHENTCKKLQCMLLSERSQPGKITYCMTPTTQLFWKRQNYADSQNVSDCQGAGGKERVSGQSTEDFFRVMKLFCMILQWWTHVIIQLTNPIECTTVR
jgi:hypothetical protein